MARPMVLWVDDDVYWLRALQSYLEEAGVIVHVGETLKEGMDRLQDRCSYDLLIFDMFLPHVGHAPFDRRLGTRLARRALEVGIRRLLAYTVLDRAECEDEMERLRSSVNQRIVVDFYGKGVPVSTVASRVQTMLAEKLEDEEGKVTNA